VPGSGRQNLKSSDGWLEFVTHPRVLDMIEQILGPDIILWGTNLFYKRPERGPATAWHRDAINNAIIKPLATAVVWIAVTDSRLENACLRCIPASHASREFGRHIQVKRDDLSFGTILDPAEYDETSAVDIELSAGQMVLFDVFTIHGARHNLGTIERTGFAMRYMPATSHYDHDATPEYHRKNVEFGHDTRALLLVRGIDRCGRNDFRRGHPGLDPRLS
jgi:ectoine hydroxylase-related dioxygenase (phytanoyl-CoA dioxygenase family)